MLGYGLLLVIRLATPDDAERIARVHVETWRAAYGGLVPDALLDALSVPAGASRWESLLRDGATRTWVAADLTGFATAGPPRDDDLPATTTEVYALYVHPDAQRRGLGTALLSTAASDGDAALWVLTGNAAGRAFYAARGWSWDGTEREIDVGGAVVPEVRYRRPATSPPLAR